MAWTKEQQQAIDLEGNNILVSAGAGSGKTAVLTERVKRKVLDGTSISKLLVLTFTNAAAAEMKDRIRKALQSTPGLEEEANLVDGSYITTFDSFALSMVKKYHISLNIPKDVEITDEVLVRLKKQEILDSIFDSYYEKPTKEFLQLISDFCLKDDKELKDSILNVYSKIELKYDKSDFINHYFEIFNSSKEESFIQEYMDFLLEKQKVVKELFLELGTYFDQEFINKLEDNYHGFLQAKTYDEFVSSMDYKSISVPKGTEDAGKLLKEQIVSSIKEFKENYLIYDSLEEIKSDLESTHSNQQIIFEILQEFDQQLENYKHENHIYNFQDIARMAIQVVEENPEIQEELQNSFSEILVDEYQDTSDIQEKFISLISRNNVYMVGDIKQSIYRFRNANPDLFREKYNLYQEKQGGIKIDLLKNFRSRSEVLEDINFLFNPIMDERIGGADYPKSHQMVFGNEVYNTTGKTDQNYHMQVLTYNAKELKDVSKAEEEAFMIGNDILSKIKKPFMVFDKEKKELRPCEYRDFVILIDRSTNFDLYRKVFEYLQIPLQIQKDESLGNDYDSSIFKNILKMILCIKKEDFGRDFEYSFVSLSRSFLYQLSDEEIYEIFIHKNYQDTKLYQDLLELSNLVDQVNISELVREIFKKTEYDSKILKTTNIHSKRVREEFFYNLAKSYENLGKTVYDFVEYLETVFNSDLDLTYNQQEKSSNSCRIMTIHKSKGLEFPICYFSGYSSAFNFSELKERILFDNQYGLILPKVNESYKDTILKTLLKSRVREEEISEKIRLFYVATTRVKEQMIFVVPELEEEIEVLNTVPDSIRLHYNSFYHVLKSLTSILLPFVENREVEASKDYLRTSKIQVLDFKKKKDLHIEELSITPKEIIDSHYSKESLHIPTKEEVSIMKFGTEVHEILENLDFQNPVLLDSISNSFIKNKIHNFLSSDFMKDKITCEMYKEYEFYYLEDNTMNHGIIDLLIDQGDKMVIVDYKLKNIDDEAYNKQLNGYRSYIEQKTNKKVDCFLYSIMDEKVREVPYED